MACVWRLESDIRLPCTSLASRHLRSTAPPRRRFCELVIKRMRCFLIQPMAKRISAKTDILPKEHLSAKRVRAEDPGSFYLLLAVNKGSNGLLNASLSAERRPFCQKTAFPPKSVCRNPEWRFETESLSADISANIFGRQRAVQLFRLISSCNEWS